MDNALLVTSMCELNEARQIDRLCDDFESRQRAGDRPGLGEFLAQVSSEQRERLRAELVRIQIDFRRQRGESASVDDIPEDVPDEMHRAVEAQVDTTATENTVYSVGSRAVLETTIDDNTPATIPDFETIERIAAGGMGIVWRMRDMRVGRDVAVKVMKAEAARNHSIVRRFNDEAKICAQLNHPFIVPVHAIGRLADGRPYYVMKFVIGQTLSELFRATSNETANRIELLRIFQNVCEAIAYSHRKGVVHRDLKPQNVMVGRHGEVQLMDWGLAGILDADRDTPVQAEPDGIVRMPRRHASELTQFGDMMGTPSYMAPEQARGLTSEVDEASDVFSLGAILCELITGRPPYIGVDTESIEIDAANASLDDAYAALNKSGADPLLIGIARKCLAANKKMRFANGDEVAKAVAGFLVHFQDRLEGERLLLERERVQEAEMRRRQKLYVRFALAGSLLICAGGAMGVQLIDHQRDLQRRSAEAIQRVTQQIGSGDFVAAQAEINAASRAGASGIRFAHLDTDLQFANRLETIRDDYYTWQDGWFDCFTALDQYEDAFRAHGLESGSVDQPDLNATKLASQIRASSVRDRIVSAVDDWACLAHREAHRAKSNQQRKKYLVLRNNLLAAAQLADAKSEIKTRLRDHVLWDDPRSLADVARSIDPNDLSPDLLVLVSKLLSQEHREPFLTRCHASHAADFWINVELGRLILEEVTGTTPSDGPPFGFPATKAFSAAEANDSVRRRASDAVGFYRAAVAKEPQRVGVRLDLAAALVVAGHVQLATIECVRATELAAKSTSSDKPLLSQAFHLLGLAHRSADHENDAIEYLLLARKHDETSEAIQWNLAATLENAGRFKEAEAVFRSLWKSSEEPAVQLQIEKHLNFMASSTQNSGAW